MLPTMYPRIWLDGRVRPLSTARVRIDSPGLLFGWGVFETLRLYGGFAFDLAAHLSRMRQSARFLHIGEPPSAGPVRRAIAALVKANRICDDVAARITLVKGTSESKPTLMITLRRMTPHPDGLRRRGVKLRTMRWRRTASGPLSGHKTLNYLEHAFARALAGRKGGDEALHLDPEGNVLEGGASNVFIVRKGRMTTPALAQGILPGIARGRALRILRTMGRPPREGRFPLREMLSADEAFLTSSTNEIVPVRSVDGRRLRSKGEVWREVLRRYHEAVVAARRRDTRRP